ncbi:2-succinyl-5-enolpyruvyl-6-hydroxy-3-cyclohexene- 1-carboxylic-acid synthase [Leifsonia bigeumensis]|uniref:2-succinyl-5-enolpyruvyl-6-hydroxy-3-cyclohexene-1-carboxylate synthase n=1 Tax=Leifsonella bigeumensis TaxID=433643 RepID=A0ABP7FDY8_9MICO
MTEGSPATDFAVAVLGEFVRLGVRHIVLSPGSRSQALALAAAEFERAGLVTLAVRIDERGAGFLGLGTAVETGLPALVITTSGTAVGNLLPSVLEAHHAGVPLILLTADRPEELRGIGSNQTTDQLGMFGDFVRFAREVEAPSTTGFDAAYPRELATAAFSAALGHSDAPGPVQVNLAFREPLSGTIDPVLVATLGGLREAPAARESRGSTGAVTEPIRVVPDTVVIAGHAAGEEAEAAARAFGAPLLAEVSSGAHFGPNLVVAYRELLNDESFGGRVRRAVVFGHPTLSREVPRLLERDDVEVIVVRGQAGEAYNPGRRASRILETVTLAGEPDAGRKGATAQDATARAWVGSWVAASRALLDVPAKVDPADARTDDARAVSAFTKAQLAVFREPVTRRMLVETLWQKTWPHDRLVLGSSRLIREADRVVPGKRISVHANRGLAGIDGTIATATGIAIASQQEGGVPDAGRSGAAGITRVLLGDLAFLHDVGSLLGAPGEQAPRIQVIVGNDGGGTIFDSLEVSATASTEAFDRVLYTPHEVRIAAIAEAYGWDYLPASNRGELDEALGTASGRTVIEVPLPRE